MTIGATATMMKTTNGDLQEIFEKQTEFQQMLLQKRGIETEIPVDSVEWYSYHVLAMMEELGEVLKADKRWKTHRNIRFEKEEKLDEIADVFISAVNISLFSGFGYEEIREAIIKKIGENVERIQNG